jgi:hypothetical protein
VGVRGLALPPSFLGHALSRARIWVALARS